MPHLGVVDVAGQAILFADIPGLIEGASEGKGLGDEFLRHVSRCEVLLHLIDVNSNDIAGDYKTIRDELKAYSEVIAEKPEIIVITKADTLPEDMVEMQLKLVKKIAPKNSQIMIISSFAKKGLDALLYKVKDMVNANKAKLIIEAEENVGIPVIKLEDKPDSFTVTKTDKGYLVKGRKIERFAHRTDFENEHAVRRIRDICKKMGILNELKKQKISADDQIIFGNPIIGKITY